MNIIIKGEINSTGSTDLQYVFRISPLAQDKHGNDRVFTFSSYTKQDKRNTDKHSKERKEIAQRLRWHHRLIWQRFHDAMDRV